MGRGQVDREPEPAAEAARRPRPRLDEREERRGRDERRGRGRDAAERGRDQGRAPASRPIARKKSDAKPMRARRSPTRSTTRRDDRGKREHARAPRRRRPRDGDQARLFVSLGKKHGVSADDLRTLLAGPIGGDTARIGSVSLRDSHAHVRVPEELVDAIIAGVHGTQHNEHDVTVERARA